jgi:hypothetical protein
MWLCWQSNEMSGASAILLGLLTLTVLQPQPNLAVIASECFSSEAIPARMGRLLRRHFAPPRNDDRIFAVEIDSQA